jgi:cellulose synthase/poly-beta-1,6-N-acetylglucosamine synthase-like glycosyltransferase
MIELIIGLYNVGWGIINTYNYYPLIRCKIQSHEKEKDKVELSSQPKISVLIPAYKEREVLEECVKKLYEADYPREKLDIILLTEKDDLETNEIAEKLKEKYQLKHIIVEQTEEPRGKPRALNQGLKYAEGDIVGVIDAEDIISPDLFKKVAYKIKEENFDAIQGILDMANDYDGWKNLQFRAEYGYWFRNYLPSLAKVKFPVPLGGTTNFIKREVLEELGGWDAYNVTEDFDLGLRLYNEEKIVGTTYPVTKRKGIFKDKYKVGIFNSVTKEESPITWGSWIRQRTRWQRGKIQTLKKYIKNPPKGIKKKFHTFMACFSPHLGPMNLSGIALSMYALINNVPLPTPIRELTYINLAAIGGYMYMQAKGYLDATKNKNVKHRKIKSLICAVTLPAYWFMQWIADLRAMKQEYIEKKIFWEKTKHEGRHFQGT